MTNYKELAERLSSFIVDAELYEAAEDAAAILRRLDAQPVFWYRPTCGGEMYEGPVHNNSRAGKILRDEKPDEWKPLYAAPVAAQPQQAKPLSETHPLTVFAQECAIGAHEYGGLRLAAQNALKAAGGIKEQG